MATCKMSAAVLLLLSILLLAFLATCSSAECPPKTKPIHIPKPKPKPKPYPKGPPANPFCPRDTLKLGVCGNLLGGVVNVIIGTPPASECCALLEGLTDLEVAACLCTAIKANVLGINLNIPVSLSAIVSGCAKKVPTGFKCG